MRDCVSPTGAQSAESSLQHMDRFFYRVIFGAHTLKMADGIYFKRRSFGLQKLFLHVPVVHNN